MRTPVAILSLSILISLAAGGAEVRRVILPERLSRGNTGVAPLSPMDSAAWLAPADASLPPGGLFLRFRRAFEADGATPLRFHVSADERFVLLLDGEVVARGPDRGDPNLWFFQSYETLPAKRRHVFDAVVWKLNPGQAPQAQLSWRLGFAFAAEGAYDAALTTGKAAWRVGRLVGTRMTRRARRGRCRGLSRRRASRGARSRSRITSSAPSCAAGERASC